MLKSNIFSFSFFEGIIIMILALRKATEQVDPVLLSVMKKKELNDMSHFSTAKILMRVDMSY